jgi:hypothetical protein
MRSGYFEKGEQVGEWTNYDRKGRKYKVANFKAKARKLGGTALFDGEPVGLTVNLPVLKPVGVTVTMAANLPV